MLSSCFSLKGYYTSASLVPDKSDFIDGHLPMTSGLHRRIPNSKHSVFFSTDVEFNEENVGNAIIDIKNIRDLGERLKIPSDILDDVEKHLPEQQRLKLVEAWFKKDVTCNWKTLETVMRAARMSEWAMSGSYSDYKTDPALSGMNNFYFRGVLPLYVAMRWFLSQQYSMYLY